MTIAAVNTAASAPVCQTEKARYRIGAYGPAQQLTAERQIQLANRGIVAKDQADQSRAQANATSATVKADRAAIDSANAQLAAGESAVETARVQLGYTVIRSPINGRTGNLSVKVGNLVTANQTELMTIASSPTAAARRCGSIRWRT